MSQDISPSDLRLVYAGDRDISVAVLELMLERGVRPVALLLASHERASHAEALTERCDHLDPPRILRGPEFREERGLALLRALEPHYILSVHFPYIVPRVVLDIPRVGVLNLHPAFLPYNRGWHTPTWAILEGTPYGATLHFMTEEVDAGDIVHQRALEVRPFDTAHTLYERVKRLELEVFEEAWPSLMSTRPPRRPQSLHEGTSHKRQDLYRPGIQEIDLDEKVRAGDVLDRLRALTTDRLDEAAYFVHEGHRYRVQVTMTPDDPPATGGSDGG